MSKNVELSVYFLSTGIKRSHSGLYGGWLAKSRFWVLVVDCSFCWSTTFFIIERERERENNFSSGLNVWRATLSFSSYSIELFILFVFAFFIISNASEQILHLLLVVIFELELTSFFFLAFFCCYCCCCFFSCKYFAFVRWYLFYFFTTPPHVISDFNLVCLFVWLSFNCFLIFRLLDIYLFKFVFFFFHFLVCSTYFVFFFSISIYFCEFICLSSKCYFHTSV